MCKAGEEPNDQEDSDDFGPLDTFLDEFRQLKQREQVENPAAFCMDE